MISHAYYLIDSCTQGICYFKVEDTMLFSKSLQLSCGNLPGVVPGWKQGDG